MALALQVMGGVLQVLGMFALSFGITQTRKAFVPELGWWAARWWRAFTGWVLMRRRRFWGWITRAGVAGTVYAESLTVGVQLSASAKGRKSYGPLPDDDAKRWRLVEGRFAELIAGLQDVQEAAQDHEADLVGVREEIASARADLESRTEEHVRKLAASGLRTESWSVLLIGVGLALSTWGLILS